MLAAIVENGVVANIVVVDELGPGHYPGEGLAIGDILDEVAGEFVRPAAQVNLLEASAALIKQIDADTDAIYSAVIGQRGLEYAEAEASATAFKAAGYEGDAPESVQCWADVKGESAQWAADDILATAATWRSAQSAIRATRLAQKESARSAASLIALAQVRATWSEFIAMIRAQMGAQ